MPKTKVVLMQRSVCIGIGIFMMAFCNGVGALKCYDTKFDAEHEQTKECRDDVTNCYTVVGCPEVGDLKACAKPGFKCEAEIPGRHGKTMNDVCAYCQVCDTDLCNAGKPETSGLKCIGRNEESGETFVQECYKGQVACVAAWDCKDPAAKPVYGCSSDKNFCKTGVPNMDGLIVSEVCSCIWCPSDLCNDGGIKVKPMIGGKPTPPKKTKPTPPKTKVGKPTQGPKPNSIKVESTPKTDGEKSAEGEEEEVTAADPSNGAVGIVGRGQIGIPIGMMTLVLGNGLLKMLII